MNVNININKLFLFLIFAGGSAALQASTCGKVYKFECYDGSWDKTAGYENDEARKQLEQYGKKTECFGNKGKCDSRASRDDLKDVCQKLGHRMGYKRHSVKCDGWWASVW